MNILDDDDFGIQLNLLEDDDAQLPDNKAIDEIPSKAPYNTVLEELPELLADSEVTLSIENEPGNLVLFDDSDENTEIAMFEESKAKFALAGYDTSNLDYEDLDKLNRREDLIAIPDVKDKTLSYYGELIDNAETAIKMCNKSSSTAIEENIEVILSKVDSIQMPEECSSVLQRTVCYCCLNEKSCSDASVNVTDVIDHISKNPDLKKYLNSDTAINYITSLVMSINNFYNSIDKADEQQELLGANISAFFLQEIRKTLAEIQMAMNENRCSFVRQIKRFVNEAYYVCPKCGALLPIDSVAYIVIQAQKNSSEVVAFPAITKCSCGEVLTLLSTEYDAIRDTYLKSVKKGVTSFSKAAPDFSKGTAVSINKPPTSIIFEACSYLVTDLGADDIKDIKSGQPERIETADESATDTSFMMDDSEYMQALKEFYKKISFSKAPSYSNSSMGLSYVADYNSNLLSNMQTENKEVMRSSQVRDETNKAVFSFRDAAQFMAVSLSKDYKVLKNQAIFSFIDSIHVNSSFDDIINNRTVIECQNFLEFLKRDCPTNPKCISIDIAINLIQILNMLHADNPYRAKMCDKEFLQSEEFITFLVNKISECKELLVELIDKRTAQRTHLISLMKKCKYELGFTKIKKMPTYRVDVLNDYFDDYNLCQIIDEVSDRMIINHLSKEFFPLWQSFNVVSKSIVNQIYTSTQRDLVNEAVLKLIERKFPVYESTAVYDSFRPTTQFRMYEHSRLGKIVSKFRNNDFYNFCSNILKLPENIDSNMPSEFNDMFLKTLEKLHKIASQYVSNDDIGYLKFYLRDFTEEEILNASNLSECEFGRFIPIRLENETIDDYLKRYNFMKTSDTLNVSNAYDYMSYFDDVVEECFILYCSSLLGSFKFSSYLSGTFMYSLINAAIMHCNLEVIQDLLGISDSILSLLEKESYVPSLYNSLASGYYKVFSSIYSSALGSYVTSLQKEYESLIVFDSEQLGDNLSYDLLYKLTQYADSLPDDQKSEVEDELGLIEDYFKEM